MSGSNALAILLGLGAYVLLLLRTGSQAAVKATAEEAAKAALRQFTWPAELARELQKSRGLERQELRFKSYGALWKELRPLAIYDENRINRRAVQSFVKTQRLVFLGVRRSVAYASGTRVLFRPSRSAADDVTRRGRMGGSSTRDAGCRRKRHLRCVAER